MKDGADTDFESVEKNSQAPLSSNEDEEPQKDRKSEKEPISRRNEEVLLSKQTCNATEPNTIKEVLSDNDQRGLSEKLSDPTNGECPYHVSNKPNSNDELLQDSLVISGRMSLDSIDSELKSEYTMEVLSEDINSSPSRRKIKENDLEKTENVEDLDEKFRRHFLQTFKGLPRISQISLDNDSTTSQEKKQEGKIVTQLSTSKEDTLQYDNSSITSKSEVQHSVYNIQNSKTEINYISNNPNGEIQKENTAESTLLESENLRELNNDEKASSSNKKSI